MSEDKDGRVSGQSGLGRERAYVHAVSLPTPGGPLLTHSRGEETRVQIPAAAPNFGFKTTCVSRI